MTYSTQYPIIYTLTGKDGTLIEIVKSKTQSTSNVVLVGYIEHTLTFKYVTSSESES